MYSNAKAIALLRDLSDKLKERFKASGSALVSIVEAFYTDANGAVWPYLVLSNGTSVAAGQPVIYIEISNVDMVSKDVFGNQTYAYAPHILQLGYEAAASGNGSIPALADLLAAEFESIKTGVRLQVKVVANGTAVTAASVNAAAAAADLDDLQWPTKLV